MTQGGRWELFLGEARILCLLPSQSPVDPVVGPPQPQDGAVQVRDLSQYVGALLLKVFAALYAAEEIDDVGSHGA